MKQLSVRQHCATEGERQADLRKEIAHHRVLRSKPGLGEHAACVCGMARTQQVKTRHSLTHHSDRAASVRAAASRECGLAQTLLAPNDLLEAALCRTVGP